MTISNRSIVSFSSLQSFTMTSSYITSLHLLPFVEVSIVATLVALLFGATIVRFKKYRKAKLEDFRINRNCGLEAIPQVTPTFPIIGNFLLLLPLKNFLKTALRLSQEYGDIYKFSGANQTFVVLNSAEMVQTLLKSRDLKHLTKSDYVYGPLMPFINNGVLVSKGHFWQGQRKILMKSQSFSNLKAYMGMLNKHGRQMVEDLALLYKDEQPKPANFLISRAFLCVISEMITGYDADNKEDMDKYHHNLEIGMEVVVHRMCKPWLLLNAIWMWSPLKSRHDKAAKEIYEFAREKLEKHKLNRKQEPFSVKDAGYGKLPSFRSILDELVDAGVDDEQILNEVNTMLVGGHETVAGAIQSFCFFMALNPEFQGKCRKEIDELLGEKGEENVLTYDDVQGGLKYLERCILETMRILPPVFLFARQLQSSLNLDHKGKNIVLPTGTNVVVAPFCLQRKSEYFPEPNIFNPDRFLPEETAKRSAYAYIPFSAGPRSCLGMKFAMIEMKTIAAYIIHNFEITTTDKFEDVTLLPWITTTPEKDFVFTFKKRMGMKLN